MGGACLPTGASRGGTQARCLKRQLSLPVSSPTRVPRNTGFPPMTLPFNRSLVGARVKRISSARAPEMCPFSKTIRENQTVRETFQGFASPNGSAARCPSPGTSTIALRALLAVAEEMLEGEIAYRRGEHDAAFDRLPSGPSLQRSATNRDAGAGEASKALSF